MKNFIRKTCFALTCSLVLFASTCFAALTPMPMAIGAVDGEWTYMGRYMSDTLHNSFLEWENKMKPYTNGAEKGGKLLGLYDVYFHHEHEGNGEGQGCSHYKINNNNIDAWSYYKCILKIVPLDNKGQRYNKSGVMYGTWLLSMYGRDHGAHKLSLERVRVYDNVTHKLIADTTDYTALNGSLNYELLAGNGNNSPQYKARPLSNCPIKPDPYLNT